jgi:hypothetical protein
MYATTNPPTIGTANAQYKFWCIVEDDDAPFLVKVPSDFYVAELKQSIKEVGFSCSDPIIAKDLALWTVSHFQ